MKRKQSTTSTLDSLPKRPRLSSPSSTFDEEDDHDDDGEVEDVNNHEEMTGPDYAFMADKGLTEKEKRRKARAVRNRVSRMRLVEV